MKDIFETSYNHFARLLSTESTLTQNTVYTISIFYCCLAQTYKNSFKISKTLAGIDLAGISIDFKKIF